MRYQRAATVQTPPTDPADPATGNPVCQPDRGAADGDLAPRVVDDLRGNLRSCAEYISAGPVQAGTAVIQVEATHRWRIVYERFAGDDSLVVDARRRRGQAGGRDGPAIRRPATYMMAVVRVGDLVTFVDWTEPGVEPTEARRLATRSAGWLCVAANPPC